MTGQYRAEYTLGETDDDQKTVSLAKRKLEYLTTRAAQSSVNPAISGSETRIEKTRMNITIPLEGSWLTILEQEETLTSTAGGKEWSRSDSRFSARRIGKDVSGKFPDKFDDFLAKLKSGKTVRSKYYATDPIFDEIGANLDLDNALKMYEELRKKHTNNAGRYAEKFLVNYLRQHPDTCFDLVKVMDADPRRERLDHSAQLILWRLVCLN